MGKRNMKKLLTPDDLKEILSELAHGTPEETEALNGIRDNVVQSARDWAAGDISKDDYLAIVKTSMDGVRAIGEAMANRALIASADMLLKILTKLAALVP